ncbi:MAG TPA: DEAD/DEAH box helicase [Opitutaceae bacterium]|nr:DEAD/DEAH box helicase [Opitutaceae bacterium]
MQSPKALQALRQYLREFDRGSRERGERYARGGRVTVLQQTSAGELSARVKGTYLYHVTLTWHAKNQEWEDVCSCPLEIGCKHCYAVGLQWLATAGVQGAVDSALKTGTRDVTAFRTQWQPLLEAMLKRPLTTDEGSFLDKLQRFFQRFVDQGHRVWGRDLALLDLTTAESKRLGVSGLLYEDWWEKSPEDPISLWQFVAADVERAGKKIPEFLQPVTQTRPIHRRLKTEDAAAVQHWITQIGSLAAVAPATPAQSTLDAVGARFVDFRVVVTASDWKIEQRSSLEAAWRPAPRTFFDPYRQISASLSGIDASPQVLAALAIVAERYRNNFERGSFRAGGASAKLMRAWLEHATARTVVVSPAGEPVTFSPDVVRWKIQSSDTEEDSGQCELQLAWPDGRPFPVHAILLPGSPAWYLIEGPGVVAGPPPLDGRSAAGVRVPAKLLEEPAVIKILRRHRTLFPTAIEERFKPVPTVVTVQCSLMDQTQWSAADNFQLTLTVKAAEAGLHQKWTSAGWVDVGGKIKKTSASTFVEPDMHVAEGVAAQLSNLGLTFFPVVGAWGRAMTARLAEEFILWRQALPPEVEVVASSELASLLREPTKARMDFSLLESETHRDWFDLELAVRVEDSTLTADELALLLKAEGQFVNLPRKGWRRLSFALEQGQLAALKDSGLELAQAVDLALRGEKQSFHTLQLRETPLLEVLPQEQRSDLQRRAKALAKIPTPAVPTTLQAELRPYQREGFEFLAFLSTHRLGAILADDMGLGKTVQTLTWLLWLQAQRPKKPLRVLVVCPKSVVGNWASETARFAPSLSVRTWVPVKKRSSETRVAVDEGPHLIVVNYTQLRLQAEDLRDPWDVVILDEAQFIKNPSSKVAQVAQSLNAEHRLVLTGTPIENRLLDLWSLFAFTLPGLLGTQASFRRRFDQKDASSLERLRRQVRHFMIRRTKGQVASDLPPRTEEDLVVELETEQAKLYQAELKRARAQLLKVETATQFDRMRFNFLSSLLRLRQICCHPALIDPAHADLPSAKLEALLEHVQELRESGHQVLVFSQFVGMLEIIQSRLRHTEIPCLILTGQTQDRDDLVRQFQSDRNQTVFLLSLKAAGFGLNLTAASYVILYDPWWNPAVEAQAIDRTHRIGQVSPVNAYRLIAKDSIEQKIRALQQEKASLFKAVVQEESVGALMDLETLRKILSE